MTLYEQFSDILKNVKPYRGTNEYPFWKRTQRYKYFIPREVNGKTEFDIYYGNRYENVHISNNDYHKLSAEEQQDWTHNGLGTYSWQKLITHKNKLLTLRDDNTVQFVHQNWLHQGERGYLANIIGGWVHSDVKRGGVIWTHGREGITKRLPIFNGLRVNPYTLEVHPDSRYEIIHRKIDRKEGNELLDKYSDMFKLLDVMFKTMDRPTFIMQAQSIAREYNLIHDTNTNTYSYIDMMESIKVEEALYKNMTDDPVAYFIVKSMADNYQIRNAVTSGYFSSWYYSEPIDIYYQVRKSVVNQLYKEHDTFKKVSIPCEQLYIPASIWGIEILVNGKPVSQT